MNSTNETPIQELWRLHVTAVQRDASWSDVLNLFCQHHWFQNQMRRAATYAVRKRHLPFHFVDDVQQDALLLLAAALRRSTILGYVESRGRYGSYLSSAIYRCCARSLRNVSYPAESILYESQHPSIETADITDDRIDFREAMKTLDEPNRTVIRMFCDGHSIDEIATKWSCSRRTVYRWLKSGTEQLRVICDVDLPELDNC